MAGQSSVFPVFIRAEYDPSGRGLDSLAMEAGKAGQNAGRAFAQQATPQIEALSASVAKALSMPRNSGGSLDFTQTIAELKRAEQASEAFAAATREVASAQRSVLISNGAASREAANEVRVLNQLSREHTENTSTVRAQIAVYERLQAELNKTASATTQVVEAGNKGTTAFGALTNSARANRQATIQAGQQFQDIAISIGSGQRASTVFAQQLPQLAFALSGVSGKVGAVASFLAGPWGVALAIGAFALSPLIDGLFKAEKGADDAGRASRSLSEVLRDTKSSYEEVTKALSDYNKEAERGNAITLQSLQTEALQIKSSLDAAVAKREKIKALIDEIENESLLQTILKGGNPVANLVIKDQISNRAVSELNKQQDAIALLNKAAENSVNKIATELAKLNTDPKYEINVGFDKLRNDARASIKDIDKLTARLTSLKNQQKAAEDALDESRKTSGSRGSSNGAPTTAEVSRILLKNFGGTITSTNKGNHTKGSDHYANQAVDFVPAGGVGAITKAQIEQALAYEGILIRISKKGKQLLGPGDKGHDKHFHVAFDKARGDPANTGKAIEAAQREAAAFQSEIDQLTLSVARIGAEFDEQPRLIDRATVAAEKLRQMIGDIDTKLADKDIGEDQRKQLEANRAAAVAAQAAAADSVNRPLRDMLEISREQAAIDQLLIEGRELEAIILTRSLDLQQRKGSLTKEDVQTIGEIVADEQLRTRELEKQREIQQRQLAIVEQTGDNLRSTIADLLDGKGAKSFGNLITRQFQIVKESLTDELFESLFGDIFRNQKLKILGLDKVDEAGKEMALRVTETVNELKRFKNAVADTTNAITGKSPANDNLPKNNSPTDIVVTGQKMLTPKDLIKELGKRVLGDELAGKIGSAVESAMRGAAYGQLGGGLVASAGVRSSKTGSQLGGALGEAVFKKLAPELFKKLGDFAGPLGAIAGGILGGLVGGLLKKTPRGSTTITNTSSDLSFSGSKSLSKGVLGLGGNVQSGLANIINALGGTAGKFGVSIGQRGKDFVVDPTGKGRTKGSGVLKFKDEQEASRAALLDAINDGAVIGIRQGAQNLLRAGKDIEKQLAKATDFQGVFDRLKQREDPVGFALDTIDREFTRLRNIFMEAGASAAEYADLEKLYGLERAEAFKQASESASASLKDFLNSLTSGNDARSLRERQEAALKEFDPLAARVASGDKTAYDEFAQIAQQLLDIERQIYGSQSGYFTRLDQVTDLTRTRVDADSNVSMITDMRPGIFGSAGPNNDTAPIVGAIMGGNADLLAALNTANSFNGQAITLLSQIAAANGGGRVDFGEAQRQYY